MRIIPIESYNHATMQLAKPVYDKQKRILLAEGRTIHPQYLEKLKEMQVSYITVEDAESTGITLEEMLDMPTWMDSIQIVEQVFKEVSSTKQMSMELVRKVQQTAGKLLTEVNSRPIIILAPSTSIAAELRPFAHAVNVALITLQIGKTLKYNNLRLRDLAVGALLHDIGKTVADDESHTQKGFEIIKNIREISIISAHIAFQHHERVNGEGFPRGIKDKDFLEAAQICGLANLYENLLSKEKMPPHTAMEYIMSKSETFFSHNVIQAFFSGVPTYPPGTKVQLNTGEIGIVYKIDVNLHRPTVRISGTMQQVPLATSPTLLITSIAE